MEQNKTQPALKRSLSLPMVVLYGLGVTIGAGIYVLLGAAVGVAGVHAPVSFVLAGVVMAFSAASFAELATRYPVSAGEAAYVRAGLNSGVLASAVGYLVILSGVVSSAAIAVGSTGYIREFVDLPAATLIVVIVLTLGGVAAWGIMQSVLFASLFTIFEAGALVWIVAAGIIDTPALVFDVPKVLPEIGDFAAMSSIAAGGLLAFYAFIGFEDIVNLAEEVKRPERTLPWAILMTLVLSTLCYFSVALVAVLSVPLDELAQSPAPLSYVFTRITGASSAAVSAIAIIATLNGVIIQIIMASRVVYGMAKQGSLPGLFARINGRTQTPLIATAAVTALILGPALVLPVGELAEWTSRIVLVIFTLVNLSLVAMKWRGLPPKQDGYRVGAWVPVTGAVFSLALLASDFLK